VAVPFVRIKSRWTNQLHDVGFPQVLDF